MAGQMTAIDFYPAGHPAKGLAGQRPAKPLAGGSSNNNIIECVQCRDGTSFSSNSKTRTRNFAYVMNLRTRTRSTKIYENSNKLELEKYSYVVKI